MRTQTTMLPVIVIISHAVASILLSFLSHQENQSIANSQPLLIRFEAILHHRRITEMTHTTSLGPPDARQEMGSFRRDLRNGLATGIAQRMRSVHIERLRAIIQAQQNSAASLIHITKTRLRKKGLAVTETADNTLRRVVDSRLAALLLRPTKKVIAEDEMMHLRLRHHMKLIKTRIATTHHHPIPLHNGPRAQSITILLLQAKPANRAICRLIVGTQIHATTGVTRRMGRQKPPKMKDFHTLLKRMEGERDDPGTLTQDRLTIEAEQTRSRMGPVMDEHNKNAADMVFPAPGAPKLTHSWLNFSAKSS